MIEYEKDLYEPVKRLFEQNGYEVKGEVNNCDMVAVKGGEIIVCELKKSFNLKLVYQLLERKSVTPVVYGAVITPKNNLQNITRLVKAIDCGLIFVSGETEIAQVFYNPKAAKPKKGRKTDLVIKEFENRISENTGGVTQTKLITAYKEQSIRLLCYINALIQASPKQLRELGFPQNIGTVLLNNYYGWFVKIKKGVYALSDKGTAALENKLYKQQVEYFQKEMEDKNVQIIKK